MTNADRIRSMSSEELNEFINDIGDTGDEYLCHYMGKEFDNSCDNPNIDMCHFCVREWLESEVE